MSDSENKDNLPDPLINLQKIVEFLAFVFYKVFTKITFLFGVGLIIVLALFYLFFKLLGYQ